MNNTCKQKKLAQDSVREILVVGGSTKCPMIYDAVKNTFAQKYQKVWPLADKPDEVMAYGALCAHAQELHCSMASFRQNRPKTIGIRGVRIDLDKNFHELFTSREQSF